MTFSIAAVCPDTGAVGCAITSSSICVASRCAFAKTAIGVALTQNITNPDLGPLALDALTKGATVEEAMQSVHQAEPHIEWRQIGLLDKQGNSAIHSGEQSLGIHASATGENCLAMGNLLANDSVPQAMVAAFNASTHSDFAQRLLSALQAGLAAGGEMGDIHSAGLLVHESANWPSVDLRVDLQVHPIAQLQILLDDYQPQKQAYLTRAKDPANAESYGVPGDM
jgi:uncharacterized Ntn-hydrolase superfamily protein